jgi:hypothetical protein
MVPIRVITIHEEHPDLSRRELHNVTRAAHGAMGVKWAVDLLPEHFQAGAHNAFGYADRSFKWQRFKEAQVRSGRADPDAANDLVYQGQLRDDLLRSARNLIRAYPTRVTISLIGPEYFTLRPRRKNTSQITREVLAVNTRHERAIGDAADKGFVAALNAVRRTRKLRHVHTTT